MKKFPPKYGNRESIALITMHPTDEEKEQVKEQIMKEFEDVFTDGEDSLKKMICNPNVIELISDAIPIRLSTAKTLSLPQRRNKERIELDGTARCH